MELERRITHRLVNYWQEIKGDHVLPPESAIDSDDIPDLWDNCFIIQINSDNLMEDRAYGYSYVGRALLDMLIPEEDGIGEGNLATLMPDRLMAIYSEMLMTRLPVVDEVEEFSLKGRVIKYRQCLLPIGNSDGRISAIFGGVRYKMAD